MKILLVFVWVLIVGQARAQSVINVDITGEHQTVQGFGAFGGIKAYWENPPFYTDEFMDYFLDDLGASIVRTNIFWDLEPVNDNTSSNDLDLSKFNYKAGSNLARQIPYYIALKEAGLKKLIATSWTPPDWMKLHDDPDRIPEQCYNCNNCPASDDRRKVCGGRLDPKYYGEYAEYLVAYVKILKMETGIDLYGISIQNEPYFANPFESNVVLPEEYGRLLNIVGRKFREAALTTRIFGPEHMAEWSWGVQQNYVSNIFRNDESNPYLSIYAVHGYVDGVAPDYGSAAGWTALKNNISDKYDKPLWMTETSGYPQTAAGAMDLAKSMYLALRFGDISAWVYWSVSAEAGSEFAIMADGEPTILYYISKQYFKHIRPGAIRVDANSDDPEILTLAFKNPTDGSMSLILINIAETQKEVTLNIPVRPDEFTAYRTSATENAAETGVVTDMVSLPGESITTLVGYGLSGPSIDEIPDYLFYVGEEVAMEIPLSGISDGNGGALDISVTSSDEAVVPAPGLNYSYPAADGTLMVNPNTLSPGKSIVTLNLTNGNTVDASTFGFNSMEVSFTVEVLDVVTGTKKKENPEVKIYPNPVDTHKLIVDLSGIQGARTIEIISALGVPVLQRSNEQIRGNELLINTNGWRPGAYLIRIGDGKKKLTGKIIVH